MNDQAALNASEPNVARVWDFLLGGKDNYEVDRTEAHRMMAIEPRLQILARANRIFLRQAVHWLTRRCGVDQYLDLGCGIPAPGNTQEVAQAANPSARVVYVDNDPVPALHAAALLAHGNELVDAMQADLADPAAVLASTEVTGTLDLTRPVAVIFGMVLHFFDAAQASKIVAGYADALTPGSYVVVSCGSGDEETGGRLASEYQPDQLRNHSIEQIAGFLDGLEVITPGVVDAWSWSPGVHCRPPSRDGGHVLVAVARKGELTPGSAKAGQYSPKPRPACAAPTEMEGSSSMHVSLPRQLPAAAVAAALTATAVGCGSPTPAIASNGPEKPDVIVAAVRATDEVPLYIAQQRGFFRQQGLHVTVVPLNTSTAAVPRLVNGSIDVIAGANYVSFFGAQARGALHIKVIAPAASCTDSDFAVLTLPGSPITRPADLAGKTISEPSAASVNTLLIDAQLADHSADRASARFVPVPFVSAAAALHAHRVDAISLIEPFLTEALSGGAQTLMQLCTGPTAGLPLSGDITTAAWAARYPRTAAAFARALAQGAAVAASNRAAEEQVLAANVPITPPSLVSMVNFNSYPLTLNPVAIQQVADLMYEDRLVQAPLHVAPLLFRSTQ